METKKIKKSNFYKNKKVITIDYADVNKILVSKEESYGTKNSFRYFIGCNGNDVIRALGMKLPQMIGYVRKFEGNTNIVNTVLVIQQLVKKVQSNIEKSWKVIKSKI